LNNAEHIIIVVVLDENEGDDEEICKNG